MTDLNNVVVEGRLTSDIAEKDFGYLSTGTAKLNFSIANNKSIKKGEQWVDEPSFFDVTVWGKYAENLKSKLSKGLQVVVAGRLQQDRWQDQNGQNRSRIYINADTVKTYPKSQGGQSFVKEDIPF